MKIQFAGLFLLASLFFISACGQKGPLYLKNEPVPATTAKPVPAAAAVEVEKAADESKTESTEAEVKSEKKE